MACGRLHLPASAVRRIREVGEAAWPHEACGLLEGTAVEDLVRVTNVIARANVHSDPARRYTIDPEAFLHAEHAARRRGHSIVGAWHSHPHGDAAPSATDLAEAWAGWSYLIAGVTNGVLTELRCWRSRGDGFEEQAVAQPARTVPKTSVRR